MRSSFEPVRRAARSDRVLVGLVTVVVIQMDDAAFACGWRRQRAAPSDFRHWHKADLPRRWRPSPLSGSKRTINARGELFGFYPLRTYGTRASACGVNQFMQRRRRSNVESRSTD